MTSTIKIAVVMVRLLGLQFLFLGLVTLTYLPERLFMAGHARTPAVTGSAQLETRMLMIRVALHVLVGAALCFFARPVAKAISEGLEAE